MAGEGDGEWRGSHINRDDIDRARSRGYIGVRLEVGARAAPVDEVVPKPKKGETLLFETHLEHGLALPASNFFEEFLSFFGLQLHHLGANSIMQLSAFATLCEAYQGIWPSLDLWCRLFYLRARYKRSAAGKEKEVKEKEEGIPVDCGCAIVYRRPDNPMPPSKTTESVKNWQQTYFYVRNKLEDEDPVNLPEFENVAPNRAHWGVKDRGAKATVEPAELEKMRARIAQLVIEGLTFKDLSLFWIHRRVMPL